MAAFFTGRKQRGEEEKPSAVNWSREWGEWGGAGWRRWHSLGGIKTPPAVPTPLEDWDVWRRRLKRALDRELAGLSEWERFVFWQHAVEGKSLVKIGEGLDPRLDRRRVSEIVLGVRERLQRCGELRQLWENDPGQDACESWAHWRKPSHVVYDESDFRETEYVRPCG